MERNPQEQQEIMFKLSILEQHTNQLQQQTEAIDQGIIELESLNLDLNEIIGSKGKEVLASVGKGIFAKTKLLSESLIMDVGGGNFVKKSVPETQKVIKDQIKKLEEETASDTLSKLEELKKEKKNLEEELNTPK